MNKQPKSREGCERQANALLNSYRRDYAGGGAFGFDMATFRLNSPERFDRLQELRKLYAELPSRNARKNTKPQELHPRALKGTYTRNRTSKPSERFESSATFWTRRAFRFA